MVQSQEKICKKRISKSEDVNFQGDGNFKWLQKLEQVPAFIPVKFRYIPQNIRASMHFGTITIT